MVASLLILETCGDTVAQKARIGTATASPGPKVKASLRPIFASIMWEAFPCTLSGTVRRKGVPLRGGLGTCKGFELQRSPGYVPGNERQAEVSKGLRVVLEVPFPSFEHEQACILRFLLFRVYSQKVARRLSTTFQKRDCNQREGFSLFSAVWCSSRGRSRSW